LCEALTYSQNLIQPITLIHTHTHTHTHTRMHTRAHAHMHARTHTHTHNTQLVPEGDLKRLCSFPGTLKLLMVNPYTGLNVMRLFNDAIHEVSDSRQRRVRFAVGWCVFV